MKTFLVTAITVCAVILAGFIVFKTLHAANVSVSNSTSPPAPNLPAGYNKLQVGMSASQVTALIGEPDSRIVNARYEFKTPAEWATLHKQEDTASDDSNLGGTPSATEIRIGGILAHEVKENWRYAPKSSNAYMALAFDGTGHLLKWGSGVRPMSRQ